VLRLAAGPAWTGGTRLRVSAGLAPASPVDRACSVVDAPAQYRHRSALNNQPSRGVCYFPQRTSSPGGSRS